MTDQSLFNTENAPVTQAVVPQNDNPLANLLANIKNEAGVQKYKSVEDALVGAQNAQEYIAQLKAEKAAAEAKARELEGANSKQAELEATLAELMNKVNQGQATPATLDPNLISEYVSKALDQKERVQTAKQNQAQVVEAFVQTFGDQAEAKFDAAALELGLSRAEFNELAAKSPKVVLKAAGIGEKKLSGNPLSPPPSATSAPAFQPHKETMIKRNTERTNTSRGILAEQQRSKQMVEELATHGMSIDELSNPKNYYKLFGKKE